MRRVTLFLLTLFLLFPSCQRASAVNNGSLADALLRVQNVLGGAQNFVTTDEDFTQTNFGTPAYLDEGVVCFGEGEKTQEIGIFLLRDRSKAKEFKGLLQQYLQREAEALSSLAALYPAEELEKRLSLYENATVGSEGMLVWYFVLEGADTQKALDALTGR